MYRQLPNGSIIISRAPRPAPVVPVARVRPSRRWPMPPPNLDKLKAAFREVPLHRHYGPPVDEIALAEEILRESAERHGVTVDMIRGPRRAKSIRAARWEAIQTIARRCPSIGCHVIARLVNKNHTSVLHALGRITAKGDRP